MKLFHALAAAIAPALVWACATPAADPAGRPDFYVMRHLQKAEGPDPGLTEEGRRNAGALATLLAEAPPRAIYVSTTRRARETAQPAAERWKVPVREYDPADTPGLIARVKAERGPILVIGHSNTVPAIVEALGGGTVGPLGDGDYGIVYAVRPGQATVQRPVSR